MIEPAVRDHIGSCLAAIEREHAVRVLYAAESGSRAWGFGSPDSDYDVRFIYAHATQWYVSLYDRRDVIERPLDARLIDLAGWDVRKALRLMLASNPAFYEWLVSPIVYRDDGRFRAEAKRLFEQQMSQKTLAHHYWSIARGQWKREIEGATQVRLKKYFYVIRPLLSLQHVIHHGTPPPMAIGDLLAHGRPPDEVRDVVADLLARKRATPELGRGARLAVVDAWALEQLAALDPARLSLADAGNREAHAAADDFFRQVIGFTAAPRTAGLG